MPSGGGPMIVSAREAAGADGLAGSAGAQALPGERGHAFLGEIGRRIGEEVGVERHEASAAVAASHVEHAGDDFLNPLGGLVRGAQSDMRETRIVLACHVWLL